MGMTGRPDADFNPFDLNREADYQAWRAHKLARMPQGAAGLVVPVQNGEWPDDAEFTALQDLLRRTNMAVYDLGGGGEAGKDFVRRLGARFGLVSLDGNPYSDEDDISSIMVKPRDKGAIYIPYTDRPISWHTDGYYNSTESQVRGFILHCARPAASGGENRLLDPEIAYIELRDANPDFIRALSAPDVMTIPENEVNDFITRPAQTGPVFSVSGEGALHMRYTARKRHVIWSDAPLVREAIAHLTGFLDSDSPFIYRHRLEAGQGLVCNNVLHNRAVFHNTAGGGDERLLYRARYHDRVRGTLPADIWEAL